MLDMNHTSRMNPADKIFYNYQKIASLAEKWKQSGYEVCFTNGCFDLIHYGHIRYLSAASGLGDKLIIGINSDSSIERIKGSDRPINDEKSRTMILASLAFVDAVIVFEENTPAILIEEIAPDVLIKGGDYEGKEVVGREFVESIGGRVVLIPLEKGYSTTKLIQKIQK